MNTFTQTLSNFFQTVLRIVLWVGAGLFALTVAGIFLMGMLLAGLWALLTGRRALWMQIRQARQMRAMFQSAQSANAGFASAMGAGFGSAETPQEASAQRTAATAGPLARRRFGRVDVTDVKPRDAAR